MPNPTPGQPTPGQEGSGMPPPPPPPPPPEDPSSKVSKYVQKLKTLPPDRFFRAANRPTQAGSLETPTGFYFFYGTLTDPSMVREILGLESDPDFRPAYVKGFKCKLWGQYPALVDTPDSVVEGAVYHVRTVEHGKKLAAYETSNYCAFPCYIYYSDGLKPEKHHGYAFKYQGDPKELSDGAFDLRIWLRRMGRHAAVEKLDAKKDPVNDTNERV